MSCTVSTARTIRSVCVFCSSSDTTRAEIRATAADLGTCIGKREMRLVYGGSDMGLMGITARAALAAGAEVLGIIPRRLADKVRSLDITEEIIVETMHERKAAMFAESDVFIALPGGIGTLEETMEMLTWLQLGYSSKPVGILNADGYYDLLLQFLDSMVAEQTLKPFHREMIQVAGQAGTLLDTLAAAGVSYRDKW